MSYLVSEMWKYAFPVLPLTNISELNGVWLSQRYLKCKTMGAYLVKTYPSIDPIVAPLPPPPPRY